MDEAQKKIQKERRVYLLKLMTSAAGGAINMETYKFNHVFLVFGYTGSGKDATTDGFLAGNKKYPFSKFVRTLTRPIRPNENETMDGYFIEKDLFEHLRGRGRFFYHYEKYDGDEFGYDSVHLIFLLSRGNVIIIGGGEHNLEGLTAGVKSVFDTIPITTVFINRNKDDIIEGMKDRGGTPEQVKKRTEYIQRSWTPKPNQKFDYIIWNDELDESVKEFNEIVESVLNHGSAK